MNHPPVELTLYHYWRSSSSWRVRWALALKKVAYAEVQINLLDDSTDAPEHLARNPMGYVPALAIRKEGQTTLLAESLPIIEWLDETFAPDSKTQALHPTDPLLRARGRQLAEIVNAGTQPIQNLSVLQAYSSDPEAQKNWSQKWIKKGLGAFEAVLGTLPHSGDWCLGDGPTLADLCLVPQIYNALRFEVPLKEYPRCARIWTHALTTDACIASHPDRFQPSLAKPS